MKFLILAFTLLFSINTQAGAVKDLYSRAVEEVEFYFADGNDWNVQTVSDLKFIDALNPEEILILAQVHIRNEHSGRRARQECLVGFDRPTHNTIFIECY